MGKKYEKYLNIISMIAFPALILTGMEFMAFELFGHHTSKSIVIAVTIISIIYNQCVFLLENKREKLIIAETGFLALYVIILFGYFKTGAGSVINGFIESFELVKPYNYVMFSTAGKSLVIAETVFLAWISIIAAAGIVKAVNKGSRKAIVITGFLWLLTVMVFEKVLTPLALITSGISMAIWIFHNRIRKGMDDFKGALSGDLQIIIRVIIITVLITGAFKFAMPEDKYNKPEAFQTADSFLEEIADSIRYGSNRDSGLPEGRLYKAGEIKRNRDPVLEIKMDKPESCYLRGFTGEKYENSQWKALDNETFFNNKEMFYWLHKNNFYDFNQITLNAEMESEKDTNHITIKNKDADRKYMYLPYEVVNGEDIFDVKRITEGAVTSKGIRGKKEYSFDALPNQIKRYQNLSQNLVKNVNNPSYEQYIMDESHYNQFVYENYTEVPENVYSVIHDYLGEYEVSGNNSHFDYQMAKQNIMYFMTSKMKYSDKVKPTGKDVDFVLDFIEGKKTGYDVHYATAATMMFRYYGIPARYVEGFIVTKKDASRMDAGEYKTLDKRNAHAWVEYYHDGIGWLPFEVTPSYVGKMDSPEQLQDISSLVGTRSPEKSELEDQYEEQEENKDQNFESFLVKNKMTIILIALSVIVLVLIVLFIMWIVKERRKTAKRIAGFDTENVSEGIKNIFDYAIDLLIAYGLKPADGCLENQISEVIRLMGEEFKERYIKSVKILQEAKYSDHIMSEDERSYVKKFMSEIKEEMYSKAGFVQKLKYKYMYFL